MIVFENPGASKKANKHSTRYGKEQEENEIK